MTVYDARDTRRPRPTLRLRLTVLNGILLVGAGAVLLLLSWTIVSAALQPSAQLKSGSTVVLADGSTRDALEWQRDLVQAAERNLLIKGAGALLAVSVVGVIGAYLVA